MKVDSVHNFNQNILFKNSRYRLWDLSNNYHLLNNAEKELLEKNNLSETRIQNIREIAKKMNPSIHLNERPEILLRHNDFIFEIGETCKLLLNVFFRGIRLNDIHIEWPVKNISEKSLKEKFSEIISDYNELKKNMKGGQEKDLYSSKTLDTLYTPKYKVAPQKTENGYLTTVINRETGAPEEVYIVPPGELTTHSYIRLIKVDDFKNHPRIEFLGEHGIYMRTLGLLHYHNKDRSYKQAHVYRGGYSCGMDEYGGVGYRLIQALIEYSIKNNKDIIVECNPRYLPFYTKAGFRVNIDKDKLHDKKDGFMEHLLEEFYKYFDIPKEQLIGALKERTKGNISGFGENETLETFNRLVYLKNKYLFYPCKDIQLELTPQAKQEWLERIKSQPILT